jgi:putative (di)nucleoside polyphosphate hydrolase
MPHHALPYRLGVGMMLLNSQNQVFVAKRLDSSTEAWQMPQGGIDEGEDPTQAALRELEEEIGTSQVLHLAESREWYYYDLPAALISKVWRGKYRGQKQKWFVMRFIGRDSDINLATAHPEFSEWQWVQPLALPDLIVPFKRDLYQQLVDEFRPHWDN